MPFNKDTSLQALLGFLASEFNLTDLDPDEPIFSAGLIDSFSLVQVAAFIGEKLGVTIPTKDLTVAKMDRPRQMIDTAAVHAK
ncbi:hypothetical protein HY251_20045 [bacterium]|nr:hypothetical protein [bacterium]